jgi:two-component system nitrogen regulation response regulator NtrX
MYFLKEQGIESLRLEDDAAEMLLSHDWPGNVRELKNLAERIAVMHTGDSINGKGIAGLLCMGTGGEDAKSAPPALLKSLMEQNFNQAKESFEKCYLEFQFSRNNGIISKTAEAIGIYPSNLHAKLKKYGIASHVTKEEQ